MRRYLITAGTRIYRDAAELASVLDDLAEIDAAFTEVGYDLAQEIVDPGTDGLRRALGSWARGTDRADDAVVVYYTGHGERDDTGHFLLCSDSETGGLVDTALRTEDIAAILTSQGVRRLLVIVDTCYAATGTTAMVRVMADRLRSDLIPKVAADRREPLAFAVIAATRARELADQGVFARAFRAALGHPEIGGQRQPFLYLEAVVDNVNQRFERDGVLQHATCAVLAHESGFGFLPNPRFTDDLPPEGSDLAEQLTWRTELARQRRAELAEHFEPRGRGADFGAEAGHYFVGRTAVLTRLAGWAGSNSAESAIVVTGSPGAGKSAVLGRLVVLADPSSRIGIPADSIPSGTDPGVDTIDIAIHARHKTLAEVVAGIAAGAGVDTDSVDELITALARRTRPLVVVVDALDEAGTADDREPNRIAEELLRRIAAAPGVRVLVGTRRQVVDACGPDFVVLDLDSPQWNSQDDLAAYAEQLLLAPHGPGSLSVYDATTAPPVAAGIAATAYPNYLVARLTARTLAARDTVAPTPTGWQGSLPAPEPGEAQAAGPAFRWALAEQLGDAERRARDLLTPLAFAEGAGLPWGTVWPAVAAAIITRPVDASDIDWLLATSGLHVVEALDQHDRSVYRLYHESFADQLRADAPPGAQHRMTEALIALVPTHPDRPGRDWHAADPYVLRHLATHAAACGRLDDLVLDPEFLLAADRDSLLRALQTVTTEQAVRARAAYEHVTHLLDSEPRMPERASILHLAAERFGAETLAAALADLPGLPWLTRWAHVDDSGQQQRHIGLHQHGITAVTHVDLDDGPHLATSDSLGVVRVWALATGGLTHEFTGWRGRSIRQLTAASTVDGELVLALTVTGLVAGWYPDSDARLNPFATTTRGQADRMAVTTYEGAPIVAVSDGPRLSIWNVRTQRRLAVRTVARRAVQLDALTFVTWHGKPAVIAATSWLPLLFGTRTWRGNRFRAVILRLDGQLVDTWRDRNVEVLGAGDVDGQPVVVTRYRGDSPALAHSVGQLKELRVRGGQYQTNSASALVRRGGQPLLVVYGGGQLMLWDLWTREQAAQQWVATPLLGESPQMAAFDADDTTWIAVPAGRTALVIDIGRPETLTDRPAQPTTGLALCRPAQQDGRPAVVKTIETPFGHQSVHLYDLDTGEILPTAQDDRGIRSIVGGGLGPDARAVLALTIDYRAFMMVDDLFGDSVHWRHARPRNQFYSAIHLVGDGTRQTIVLMLDERVVYRRMPGDHRGEFSVAYHYASAALAVDGDTMVFMAGFDDLTAVILETRAKPWSRGLDRTMHTHAVAAGWIGRQPIVVATSALDLVVCDARTGERIGPPLTGHAMAPSVIVVGQLHGRSVALSGGADRTVRIWDLEGARQVALIDVDAVVTTVAHTPDGAVVIGTETGVLRVDIAPGT